MKSTIIYYSFSGNTKKIAECLAEYVKDKGEVEIFALQAIDESKSFFGQCRRAFAHTKAQIQPANFDLSEYDLICFGTPVWAFGPAPAMNAYLEKCFGLGGKDIILFTTYGSGTGNGRCLNYMQNILSGKGAKSFKRVSIQQFKVKDKEYANLKIKKALG